MSLRLARVGVREVDEDKSDGGGASRDVPPEGRIVECL